MWENYLDYKHGTGHGVGCYLNDHEGPTNSPTPVCPMEEGMVISIEPGIYRAGLLGVRTENLVTVVRDKRSDEFGQFFGSNPSPSAPSTPRPSKPRCSPAARLPGSTSTTAMCSNSSRPCWSRRSASGWVLPPLPAHLISPMPSKAVRLTGQAFVPGIAPILYKSA